MPTAEKLRLMEELWTNLTHNADAYDSPAGHGDVRRERDKRVAESGEPCMKWEDAKRKLRNLAL